MIARILLSVLAFALYGAARAIFNPISTLLQGQVAEAQLLNSDAAAVATSVTLSGFSTMGIALNIILLVALVAIWWRPASAVIKTLATTGLVLAALSLAQTDRAWAFADTTDKTEAYTILPNQSAFWVPDTGANKDSQVQMESESYYNERKIAAKRFVIPHAKLGNSGGWLGWDFYVPTGRLYIVDRTPYSREWVDATDRGTTAKKEGFPCQSKDGLNITVGISIGTSVSEDNAAKFLYNFGVTPPKGDPSDPKVIFASVYYGRSLQDVMDDVGRKKVQTLVCGEIGKRTFDQANADMMPMMKDIEKNTRDYFASVGITLSFIGWADTFEYDKDVQTAINQKYVAETLAPLMPVLQEVATVHVQEGMGSGMDKHGLPIVVTPQMLEALMRLAPTVTAAGTAVTGTAK